jgi:hypothetical protein
VVVNNLNVDSVDVNENVNVNNPEQVLLSQEVVNVDHVDVDVNDVNVDVNNVNVDVNNIDEKNPDKVLLADVNAEDVDMEQVLLVNVDHVVVDENTETVENADVDVNTETVENADVNNGNVTVNVNRTKVRSIEALVCELRRAREQELLRAREREVLDNFSELPFRVTQKMSGNLERGSSCPLFTQGKGFKLWKQEVEAWQICVQTTDNKARLAVDLAIHLPHGHPLKIKERVLDPVEFSVTKLNKDDGVKKLLEFMETKVFYNNLMTDRYKLWQDLSKIARDKHQTKTSMRLKLFTGKLLI